jgi:glyceraldehyde-3-phosphate dehydrogenase (NADP+)
LGVVFFVAVQVVRSADLVSYAAEEGIRILAAGRFIVPDCFPGNGRNKLCMASKVHINVM